MQGLIKLLHFPPIVLSLTENGTDADGNIVGYRWERINGPTTFDIVNPDAAVTTVKKLVEGVYEFELRVKDDQASFARDTVYVFVIDQTPLQGFNVQLIPVGSLSKKRDYVAAATAGNKILFAGGVGAGQDISSRVDIYDISTQTWSTAELSEARSVIGAATVGNKVLFAGGAKNYDYDGWYNSTRRVDIYDVTANAWSTTELPEARNFLYVRNGAIVGDKVFFAGRLDRDQTWDVQVYDVSANSWSSIALKQPRWAPAMAAAGNKIFIAGGAIPFYYLISVEVYDAASNTWSIDTLSEARREIKAATLNNKVNFAGGYPYSDKVDIYDYTAQYWSTANLSRATVLAGVASSGQRICFFGDKRVDIYDESTNAWSIADLPVSILETSAIIAAGGNIYVTDGDGVWRIEF